jgi:hypothetical protein
MRSIHAILTAVAVYSVATAHDTAAGKAESVEFAGHELLFAFQGKDFREFIPPGEKLEHWTKLASIRVIPNWNNPEEYAQTLARLVNQNTVGGAASALIYNPKKGIAILDFATWPPDVSYVEFNVWRIEKRINGGLVAYQYAVREYEHKKEFMLQLKDFRRDMQREMIEYGVKINRRKSGQVEIGSQPQRTKR